MMGHELRERSNIGRVNAIMILPDGNFSEGADRRGDNSACGF
jgi:gamma-glutamyltranspeptidase/glutathione hydrolase